MSLEEKIQKIKTLHLLEIEGEKLRAQYSICSEALEYFPRTSKHKAANFLNVKINSILAQIESLKKVIDEQVKDLI